MVKKINKKQSYKNIKSLVSYITEPVRRTVRQQFGTFYPHPFSPDLTTLSYIGHRQADTVPYRTILLGIANEDVTNQ
jgi:hypothetical protein